MPGDLAADIADAEKAVRDLNTSEVAPPTGTPLLLIVQLGRKAHMPGSGPLRSPPGACIHAHHYASAVATLHNRWIERIGRARRNFSARLLLAALPGAPLTSVKTAAPLIGRSTVNTSAAINRLVEAGVLTQRNIGKQRYRVFEAPEIIDLITEREQVISSSTPDGDGSQTGRTGRWE